MEHEGPDWAAQLTRTIGKRVAYYRQRATDDQSRKLTAQALADRCTALGLPTGRPAIAKLESGVRQTISVAEVLVLARALGVHPVDLLIPLGYAEKVEILPGETVSAWSAFKWFTGGTGTASMAALWESHEKLAMQLLMAYLTWQNDEGAQVEAVASGLRSVRAQMRDKGMTPPVIGGDTGLIYDAAGGDEGAVPVATTLHLWLDAKRGAPPGNGELQVTLTDNGWQARQYVGGKGWIRWEVDEEGRPVRPAENGEAPDGAR